MDAYLVNPSGTRDIASLMLDECRQLKVVSASTLAATTAQERLLFGVQHGLYSFPTEELCQFLRSRIAGRSAIEIGAGHGVLAKALGIPATDNRQQEEPAIKAHYAGLGQPTVPYGDHVEKLDAHAAVEKFRPSVVVACWTTHRFDPARPHAGGSAFGVNEKRLIESCDEYIFIGNEHVHREKSIWTLPHEKITPPWVYSRAVNGTPDFIAIWRGGTAMKGRAHLDSVD
ncbi:hypothetical protein [Hydrogenophaga sp. BPS33]|uniref:hypothetical protein n=1 Tax=Hydrogenophaga sp. BPS33 TaxID=2651974 RepID=UPI0013203F68|nr:hypothetical protein [Hydrogenophaga sp. BPS33]QHE89225.1 hypothetical protein F9K07_30025 [Hydrogenophaga sp. BPS33]